MNTPSPEARLDTARKAWGALQQAEGQIARLLGYTHQTHAMKEDRRRWEQQREQARSQLQQALAVPVAEQYSRGEANYVAVWAP